MEIILEGKKNLIDKLKLYSIKKTAELKQVVIDSCINIETEAKKIVPVDTGRLRSSITYKVELGLNIIGTIGTNVKYAPYVEFGTKKMKAQSYLLPSYNRLKNGIINNIKYVMQKGI